MIKQKEMKYRDIEKKTEKLPCLLWDTLQGCLGLGFAGFFEIEVLVGSLFVYLELVFSLALDWYSGFNDVSFLETDITFT